MIPEGPVCELKTSRTEPERTIFSEIDCCRLLKIGKHVNKSSVWEPNRVAAASRDTPLQEEMWNVFPGTRQTVSTTTTTTTTSEAGSTRPEFGEVRKLHAIKQGTEYSSRQLWKNVIVKSLGGVKVGESSCSFQDGSETAQRGCRPEVAEHPFSSAQTLAWPVWTDTGFTGLTFDDEFTCSSPEFGWDGEQSVKRLRIRGEKQHWDLSGGPNVSTPHSARAKSEIGTILWQSATNLKHLCPIYTNVHRRSN